MKGREPHQAEAGHVKNQSDLLVLKGLITPDGIYSANESIGPAGIERREVAMTREEIARESIGPAGIESCTLTCGGGFASQESIGPAGIERKLASQGSCLSVRPLESIGPAGIESAFIAPVRGASMEESIGPAGIESLHTAAARAGAPWNQSDLLVLKDVVTRAQVDSEVGNQSDLLVLKEFTDNQRIRCD